MCGAGGLGRPATISPVTTLRQSMARTGSTATDSSATENHIGQASKRNTTPESISYSNSCVPRRITSSPTKPNGRLVYDYPASQNLRLLGSSNL